MIASFTNQERKMIMAMIRLPSGDKIEIGELTLLSSSSFQDLGINYSESILLTPIDLKWLVFVLLEEDLVYDGSAYQRNQSRIVFVTKSSARRICDRMNSCRRNGTQHEKFPLEAADYFVKWGEAVRNILPKSEWSYFYGQGLTPAEAIKRHRVDRMPSFADRSFE
ncbi:hypothetical protein M1525_00715 [Patescibacteria group bacterium]|nr:hypothetical protein [Patescibacteria group bacterium]